MYMLDTNICIYLINEKSEDLALKIATIPNEQICISAITHAELEFGVAKSQRPDKNIRALTKFLATITVLPFDSKASEQYGIIRASLERVGQVIGQMDMLIAAHAKSNNFTVVTNNVKEFERVHNLKIEDWTI